MDHCNPSHLEKNGIKIIMMPLRHTLKGSKASAVSQHANYQFRIVYSNLAPQKMVRFKNKPFVDHGIVASFLHNKRLRSGDSKEDVSTVRKFMEKLGANGLPLWNGEKFFVKERHIRAIPLASVSPLCQSLKPVSGCNVMNELKQLLDGGTAIGTMVMFEGGKAEKGYPAYGQWVYEGSPTKSVGPLNHTVVMLGIVQVDSQLALKFQCPEGEYVLYQESQGPEHAHLSILGDGLCLAHPRVFLKAYQIPCRYFTPEVLQEPINW